MYIVQNHFWNVVGVNVFHEFIEDIVNSLSMGWQENEQTDRKTKTWQFRNTNQK